MTLGELATADSWTERVAFRAQRERYDWREGEFEPRLTGSPYVILNDFGGAFSMGAIGGGIWHGIKGARNSPKVSPRLLQRHHGSYHGKPNGARSSAMFSGGAASVGILGTLIADI